ncbi:MAG: hypothetical protein HC860_04580 [Alkalinema sp. RU_4_3]|nr:hypothetical protein [Alkalinema sp. RU_4_3]
MSNRQLAQAFQQFSREAQRLYRNLNRKLIDWLLRSTFVSTRRGQNPVAGFILPTTVLLLLVVTLTVGAITLRAVDRNTQVIANTQQKVIYNAATPAIDRARAKIEFLFDPSRDTRYPGGVPKEGSYILPGMLNNGKGGLVKLPAPESGYPNDDVYTLPGETRLNIGGRNIGTGTGSIQAADPDNAWSYRTDTDGDGNDDATVVYSILFQTPSDDTVTTGGTTTTTVGSERLLSLTDEAKAKDLLVRNAPISNDAKLSGCSIDASGGAGSIQDGWFPDKSSSSKIRKNFQVDAIVIPDNPKAAAVTIEFQQDRQLDKGNKWGAWFRYDLEVFPGPKFNWNGAIHTEGNLIPGGGSFEAFLVSSPKSCLFQRDSSEISITRLKPDDAKDQSDLTNPAKADGATFVGQLIMAKIARNEETGSATFHYHDRNDETKYGGATTVTRTGASGDSTKENVGYADVLSDPVAILLNEQYQSRGASASNRSSDDWPIFSTTNAGQRIRSNREKLPYVDDLYRADDRWGPKPKYDSESDGRIPTDKKSGDAMDKVANARLMNLGKPGESSAAVGLDGYWERRARIDGMRILVGERLELGDIGGWETPRDVDGNNYITPPNNAGKPTLVDSTGTTFMVDPAELTQTTLTAPPKVIAAAIKAEEKAGDPLYPPTVKPYPVAAGKLLDHRMQARRTLRDNLPAVQSAAIYHAGIEAPYADNDVDYPVACLSMTSHPGNVHTLRNSINFIPTFFAGGNLQANFFTGQGTNGWEFQPPSGDYATFVGNITNKTSPLRIALDNLANFAGDPDGAFPPKQEDADNVIHPYPALTMWGNYSNLRRALKNLDAGAYKDLSVADKTYIQTAACTLGMLAYNVDRVQAFNVTDAANDGQFGDSSSSFIMQKLAEDLVDLMDGYVGNGEVLPKTKLKTYKYDPTQVDIGGDSPFASDYDPADYYEVPPEAYIAALKQKYAIENADDPLTNARVRLAELIMLKHQIRRDRTFGFRSSPAFGEYAVDKMSNKTVAGLKYGGGTIADLLVFPTACDPDLFVFNSPDFSGKLQQRVPFTPFPFTSADASSVKLLDMPTGAGTVDPAISTTPGAVVSQNASKNLVRYRVALSRLCGTIDATNYRDNTGDAKANAGVASLGIDTNISAFDPKRKAMVKPMFPALYYLFPEVEHTLQGSLKAGSTARDAEIADEPDAYDHRQPGALATAVTDAERIAVKAGLHPKDKESYVVDTYIGKINTGVVFKPVDPTPPTRIDLGNKIYTYTDNKFRNVVSIKDVDGADAATNLARRPYLGSAYPVPDLPVGSVAIQPRSTDQWQLPIITPETGATDKDDISINTILVPNGALSPNMPRNNGVRRAIPFLDRAIYDGRQDMMVRVTDIDLGMLRKTKPKTLNGLTSYQNTTDKPGQNEVWLPMSGIVYAFREDAVREDGIARKARTIPANIKELEKGTSMNQTDLANPFDSQVIKDSYNISLKPIDFLPDPDRRVHGFRLRNGSRLDRPTDKIGSLQTADNIRGLSFFTDQPVYMEGDFNIHQNASGAILQEFKEKLPETINFTNNDFYNNRVTLDPDFAKPDKDRWRPAEVLADAIDVLSNNFCDGSAADAFMPNTPPDATITATPFIAGFPDFNPTQTPTTNVNRTRYQSNGSTIGGALYGGRGCTGNGRTSFQNQAGPLNPATTPGNTWDWMRENSVMPVSPKLKQSWQDFTTPVRISRTGDAFIINRPEKESVNAPLAGTLPDNKKQGDFRPVRYELDRDLKYVSRLNANGGFALMTAADTRINSIVVGGIQPSRKDQTYGGLHNFPRFLEDWGNFFFSGSFIQLNFSNYATGTYEKEGLEPIAVTDSGGAVPVGASTNELIPYYGAPNRLWGYDVALQFAPAGPAAARFVTPSSTRSEFYSEPPRTDPYIRQLCIAGKTVAPTKQFNCP